MIIVVSGPGGAGKGTVVAAWRERDPKLYVNRSWTTRERRPGEAEALGERGMLGELVGVDVAVDLEVLLAGLEVLSEGEDGEAELAELVDDLAELLAGLAEAEHEAGLDQGAALAGVAPSTNAASVSGDQVFPFLMRVRTTWVPAVSNAIAGPGADAVWPTIRRSKRMSE